MYRGVIYDCDGVLVDSTITSAERFFSVATLRGLPVTLGMLEQKHIVARMGGDAIKLFWPDEDVKAFYSDWEAVDLKYNFKPIPGTRETLETLRRRHYQSSVLSNRGDRTLVPLIDRLGLTHLLAIVYGCAGKAHMKPDLRSAEPLLSFYGNKLSIGPKEIIFVGDSAGVDWPVARENGIGFIGVLTGVSTDREFLEAGVPSANILCSIAELPGWLEKHDS